MFNEELIQKIKAEIERLKDENRKIKCQANERYCSGYDDAFYDLVPFIDTLESEKPVPNDLDEAADNHIREVVDAAGHPGWEWETRDIKDAFIAGANWQYQKDRGEFAKIKAKTWCEGFDSCKEQMMKKAVEGEAHPDDCEIWVNLVGYGYDLKDGQKVKLIICKED